MSADHASPIPTPSPSSDNRVESIQWLRGFAAMLVVFNHAALLALENAPQSGGAWRMQAFNFAWLGGIGVDVFFVISGFVMALSAGRFAGGIGAAHFLLQRYNRIAPLFYLMSAVLLAEMLRASVGFEINELINTFIFIPLFDTTVYSWPIHYLGWTLAYEFIFYMIVATLIVRREGPSRRWLLGLLVAFPFLGIFTPIPWMPWQMLTSPMMWEFGLGVAIFLGWRSGIFTRLAGWWRVGIAIALIVTVAPALTDSSIVETAAAAHWTREGATVRFLVWGVPAGLLVAGFFTLHNHAFGALTPALKLLGDISYSLYLSHLFVVRLTLEAIQRAGLDPFAAMVLVMLASPVVAWLVYRWLEQPLLRVGQGRVRALITLIKSRHRRLGPQA